MHGMTTGKNSNTKFHENPSTESRVVPCGRTDRQTGITMLNSRVSQFCETRLKNEMGQAWHDLQRREMRTRVSAWGDGGGANVGDNINTVIKVTGYCCTNIVL
jgi:hypothetical protein